VIVVEGKYDKNALRQVVDATVLTTDGFAIFKDHEKKKLLMRLAEERGLIVLTDGDGAGFVIRNHLKGLLPKGRVKHAYIPDVRGRERRKKTGGRAGLLGVEGMRPEVLLGALRRAGATTESGDRPPRGGVTKADFMEDELSGRPHSAARRAALLNALDLPARMTANALLEVLNLLCDREAYKALVAALPRMETAGSETVEPEIAEVK
jgi:ribonuclease M5